MPFFEREDGDAFFFEGEDGDALKLLDVIIAQDSEHWWYVKKNLRCHVGVEGPSLFIHIVCSCCICMLW